MLLPFSCHVTCTVFVPTDVLGASNKQVVLCFSTAVPAVQPCFDESIHSAFHPVRATQEFHKHRPQIAIINMKEQLLVIHAVLH